jgi:hypothetical protein
MDLTVALVQNVNKLMAYHLKERKEKKKETAMTSRMGPETEKLFILLSSHNWKEKKPELNSFATKQANGRQRDVQSN